MTYFKSLDKKKHFKWLEKCLLCWEACEQCISESITSGKHLSICNICRDCAEICSLCIKFEAQKSGFFENLCQVCADICTACAKECEKYANESVACAACAEACRVCAEYSLEAAGKSKGSLSTN
jgi:hypothetical protein